MNKTNKSANGSIVKDCDEGEGQINDKDVHKVKILPYVNDDVISTRSVGCDDVTIASPPGDEVLYENNNGDFSGTSCGTGGNKDGTCEDVYFPPRGRLSKGILDQFDNLKLQIIDEETPSLLSKERKEVPIPFYRNRKFLFL